MQLVVHALYAVGWLRYPDIGVEGDLACVDPPCGPEALPPPEVLPVAVPFVLMGLAIVVGLVVLAGAAVRSLKGDRSGLLTGLLLVAAPLVLVGRLSRPHLGARRLVEQPLEKLGRRLVLARRERLAGAALEDHLERTPRTLGLRPGRQDLHRRRPCPTAEQRSLVAGGAEGLV